MKKMIAAATACLTGVFVSTSTLAETGYQQQQRKQAEIPHCARSLGAIAIHEPDSDWWSKMQLGSPTAVLKIYVAQSGCFKLLDRGAGMQAAEQERAYAARGTLQKGSNIGAGQVRAADYVLVPDLVTHNQNAGGNAIGGILGALLPGTAGVIASGINFSRKDATVTLAVTDVRSSEQVALAEGHGKKTDIGWGAGGGLFGTTGGAGLGATGYTNTEAGQVIALAFLDGYISLVRQMGGLPADASQANVQRALSMSRQGRLYSGPSMTSKPLGTLEAGTLLYPTGNKSGDGNWIEVKDELDHNGWVSSFSVQSSK